MGWIVTIKVMLLDIASTLRVPFAKLEAVLSFLSRLHVGYLGGDCHKNSIGSSDLVTTYRQVATVVHTNFIINSIVLHRSKVI